MFGRGRQSRNHSGRHADRPRGRWELTSKWGKGLENLTMPGGRHVTARGRSKAEFRQEKRREETDWSSWPRMRCYLKSRSHILVLMLFCGRYVSAIFYGMLITMFITIIVITTIYLIIRCKSCRIFTTYHSIFRTIASLQLGYYTIFPVILLKYKESKRDETITTHVNSSSNQKIDKHDIE